MKNITILSWVLVFSLLAVGCSPRGMDWNENELTWFGYTDGMNEVRTHNKPAIIIVYAKWCRYCKKYSRMFHDADIVNALGQVVLVKIDADDPENQASKNGLHGTGVPRTFALDRAGGFILNPNSGRNGNQYFSWISDKHRFLEFINLVASR